ncbi:hypothetical protein EMCG_07613 [[Emmonsia] crescens]|uniref:Uncharacterized protein n=1 Tax=[Emmonsia] crescens TaxID=73230 RepID=A0A0G2I8W2_9EURO|nr:hypothetical protein EMCG_07613 [Emmonsia crescens UAMH 3008]
MSMNRKKAWQALISQLNKKTQRHFLQINVLLSGGVPALNDLLKVETMIGSACEQGIEVQSRRVLSLLMIISLFFKLFAKTVIQVFSELYQSAAAKFVLEAVGLEVSLLDEDTCSSCDLYCLPVHFSVKTLDKPLKLMIEVRETQLRLEQHQSVRWFCRQQGLDLNFEAFNHGMSSCVYCRICQMKIGRKQVLSFSPGTAEQRKIQFA